MDADLASQEPFLNCGNHAVQELLGFGHVAARNTGDAGDVFPYVSARVVRQI